MPKLIMFRGISGSGKSTIAKDITKDGNTYRVNRDELRPLISAKEWNREKERMVVAMEKAMAFTCLSKGKTVIVDDTNLVYSNETLWKSVVADVNKTIPDERHHAKFEIREINTPLEDCIYRDSLRLGRQNIGEAIIQRQAMKSGMYNVNTAPNSIAIYDLDGTIFDGDHRVGILDDKTNKNRWKEYFALCGKDAPIPSIIKYMHLDRLAGKTILLVSGRAADLTFDETKRALAEHKIPYDRLLMRLGGDGRKDTEVKQEILNEILLHHPKSAIAHVYDDRFAVCEMWRKNGLTVYPVYKGHILLDHRVDHSTSCSQTEKEIKGICSECKAVEDF